MKLVWLLPRKIADDLLGCFRVRGGCAEISCFLFWYPVKILKILNTENEIYTDRVDHDH